ncbi:hypothetical protein CL635_01010 [bacterium]|jgi:hypothetical protein|nr:hypothetical protein [bacterium]|tara:strand:+ start:6685 stop:7551 length:867 start_codon:yes stop_codon:yes gene_type:complete
MNTPDGQNRAETTDYNTVVKPDFARRYLETYFKSIDEDERRICTFLAEEYAKLVGNPEMIDIGCGPCIQHVLSATPYVSSIQLADYLDGNLDELRNWIQSQETAFDWTHFTEFILQLESADSSAKAIAHRESTLRSKVVNIRHANVLDESVIGEDKQFGAVGFFYCAEAAAKTKPEWQKTIANVARLVEPGGRMFIASCRNTNFYTVKTDDGKDEVIPTASVNEDDFAALLPNIGFSLERSRIEVVNVGMGADHGIEDILLLSLQKNGEKIDRDTTSDSVNTVINKAP